MINDKHIIVKIPSEQHRKLKILLAIEGKSIADWLRGIIEETVSKHKIPKASLRKGELGL